MLLATRSASLEPAIVRAVGLEVAEDLEQVVVLVPEQLAGETIENLRASSRVAITMARTYDHRTFQLKADCLDVSLAGEAHRALAEGYRSAFAGQLEMVGIPRRITTRVRVWPCLALRLRVTDVFAQTPGPGAGERWHPFSDALEAGRGTRETLG
ncbi:MAG: hypothetical protein IT379_13380 [Deltaproteobacteria bacterium]|nr:hypothetical protein [Deltaproteobacteria bacterium]